MNGDAKGSSSILLGHAGWRRVVLLIAAAFYAAWFPFRSTPPGWSIVLIIVTGLSLGAGLLSARSARQFGEGEPARQLWRMVALIGLVDALATVAFALPRVIGTFKAAGALTIAATALSSLSRIALAVTLWLMVRVYRKGGLTVRLGGLDYVAIATMAVLGVTSVVLSGSVVRAVLYISGPHLIEWVRIAGIPNVLALIACSVFGVMVWKYAKQMGGGLVAKAWSSILFYAFLWIFRLGFLGTLTYVYGIDPFDRPTWVKMVDYASILGAGCFLFLGASYQHEACTSEVMFDESEMEAFVQSQDRPLA